MPGDPAHLPGPAAAPPHRGRHLRILPRRPRIRLSAAEHLDAYDDRLAEVLPRGAPVRAPGQAPRLLLVAGQQGAGKSTTQRYLHAALGPDRVASYDGDDDAEVHPRYEEIARAYGRDGHHRAGEAMPAGLARGSDPLRRALRGSSGSDQDRRR